MQKIIDHIGEILVAAVIMVALVVIVQGALKTGGYVDTKIQTVITSIFDKADGTVNTIK